MSKEAQARIKINKLLESAGWRFFDAAEGTANIALEPNVQLTQLRMDALGNDFDSASRGFVDFLLLDASGFPLVVLEAKAEKHNPLVGKEQARKSVRPCRSTTSPAPKCPATTMRSAGKTLHCATISMPSIACASCGTINRALRSPFSRLSNRGRRAFFLRWPPHQPQRLPRFWHA